MSKFLSYIASRVGCGSLDFIVAFLSNIEASLMYIKNCSPALCKENKF